MAALRAGVIGVGHLGQHHARVYAEMDGVDLVGVVDTDPSRAREVAGRFGVEALPGPEPLLGRVDAVSVATPTKDHLAAARPFLESGVSVLVEKPLAGSVAEAEELVALAQRSGAALQVGHIERFNPAVRAVLDQAVRPVFIEAHRMSPFRFRSVDVGVVFDLMIHDIDLARRFVGAEIESVDAAGAPVISPREDIASARLSFANGCVANLTASRVSLDAMRKIRLFAPDRYVSIDTQARKARVFRKNTGFDDAAQRLRESGAVLPSLFQDLDFSDLVSVEELRFEDVEPLKAELQAFIAAARSGEKPEVTGEDGLRCVEIAAAIVAQIQSRLSRVGQ